MNKLLALVVAAAFAFGSVSVFAAGESTPADQQKTEQKAPSKHAHKAKKAAKKHEMKKNETKKEETK